MTSATVINALPTTSVTMNPYRLEGTAGQTVAVDLKINSVLNLFAFQVGVSFNAAVCNITNSGVTEGGFLSNSGSDSLLAFPGSVNNTAGVVKPYGWTLLDPALNKNGSGTLVHFAFKMKQTGFSDLHILGLKLVDKDGATQIPTATWDYSTIVTQPSGNQYVVRVIGNPYSGQSKVPYSGYSTYGFDNDVHTIGADTFNGELNFTVVSYGLGPSPYNYFAYFNATIPDTLMNGTIPGGWALIMNNVQQSTQKVVDNGTCTTMSFEFTYNQLPQLFSIYSTNAVPEFPMVFLATLLVIATFAAAILGKSTWTARRKT